MTIALNMINPSMKAILHTFMKIDDRDIAKIPMKGPLILATNHINSLDAPVGFTHLHPRPLTAFVKVETWDNPVLGLLFNIWKGIPIRRGEVDFDAFRLAQDALLKDNKIVIVAPEGTRSKDGKLNKGYPGIVLLAIRSGVPILPVVFYGNESVGHNLRSLRRTKMTIRVGEPFTISFAHQAITRDFRQEAIDEVMYQIAALLPVEYRGVYADTSKATTKHLKFLSP
ncbi:MAG: lysophospholipid acyltransferase family protein [Anaerolineaceae bacterium]